MDRSTVLRWIFIAAAVLLIWKCGIPLITGNKSEKPQSVTLAEKGQVEQYTQPSEVSKQYDPTAVPFPVDKVDRADAPTPDDGASCTIATTEFTADLVERGAGIKHFKLRKPQYAKLDPSNPKEVDASEMATTQTNERWRSLRTLFRAKDTEESAQVKYDRFMWKLEPQTDPSTCTFTYEDPGLVKIVKTIHTDGRPYELQVDTTITNLDETRADGRVHEFAIQEFAYRSNEEMKGSLGRVSPFQTELSCARDKEVERKSKDDFKDGWFDWTLSDRYAAISNYYFAQALVPLDVSAGGANEKPACRLLSEHWMRDGQAADADDAGNVFHAELRYNKATLAPKQSATYRHIAFFGPKERDILAAAAGGTPKLGDLINLGFFSAVAKVLVAVLTWIHAHITFGNWGIAIIVMTFGVRLILFPLAWKQIKTTIGMRRLKPEIDALTKKFKDDPQAKNLAMMELYRKHKVNPLSGCLPQLVQMPVWFAMYTTLQTAVEMYHTQFLWFRDLSAPDKFYVLPILLGGLMILQQRITPQQGMDPLQQKMMNWLLPIIFTVMMLFLPAALGVYMLTNSMLSIVQQLLVEKFAPRNPKGKDDDIVVKVKNEGASGSAKGAPALVGKGKARV